MEKTSLNSIILNNAINLITSANIMLKKALITNNGTIFSNEEIEEYNLDFYINNERYAILEYYTIKNEDEDEENDYEIFLRVLNTDTNVVSIKKASYVETYFRYLYVNMLSVIAEWDDKKLNKN